MDTINNKTHTRKHHYHSPYKRALFSFLLISSIMIIGITGMHVLEHMSYLDAFYFMSMIATAQGPTIIPQTPAGKVFASFMAFMSVGFVVAALGFLFGPFLGKLGHIGAKHFEENLKK
jgi:hypothetical protein